MTEGSPFHMPAAAIRAFIVALDVARFLPLDAYKADVDRHIAELKDKLAADLGIKPLAAR